jgi:hypothetical protein
MGDCPQCKNTDGSNKMPKLAAEDLPQGGSNWIQDVVKHMKKGSFTKQAKRHHETPVEYAADVLAHKKKHTLKTRRRAQFLLNISKRKGTRKVSSRK